MNQFRYCLAQVFERKLAIKGCFTFTSHRTNAYALAGKTKKNGNCILSLKFCMLFCHQT